MIALSILVSGVPSRLEAGGAPSFRSLLEQAQGLPDVEVLYLVDNKRRTVGGKRGALLSIARGLFVAAVDDDDEVSPEYVRTLRDAILGKRSIDDPITADCEYPPDVICFPIRVTLNGEQEGIVRPSVHHPNRPYSAGGVTLRRPIQIACWRRELVKDIPFPDLMWGEDHKWGDLASARVQRELFLEVLPLYHYKYDSQRSEAPVK